MGKELHHPIMSKLWGLGDRTHRQRAGYGLQDQLRENDALREEENVQAAEDESSIPYDHNYYYSESSGASSEPASSHPRPWTSKTKVFKRSRSYISCVVDPITLNIVTCCLQDGNIYLNMTKLETKSVQIFKMLAVRQYSFLLKKMYVIGIQQAF